MTFGRNAARLAATAAGALTLTALPAGAPAQADHAQPQGAETSRRIVAHTVRPGDTATGLAVRYHAWTAELIELNHLGPGATVYVGQRLRIPVVRGAATEARAQQRSRDRRRSGHQQRSRDTHRSARPVPSRRTDPVRERARMRSIIARTARAEGVDPELALAVSWQEAGWRMHHVSSAGAIGAMQVLPGTGTWMALYAGRALDLRDARDNVLAGVLLLDVLADMTDSRREQIGAYYQGVGSVLREGLDRGTRHYVANVWAIQRRLERGLSPAPG